MAEPVFAAGTKILVIEDMHSKHTFKLGGPGVLVKQRSKSGLVTVLQDLLLLLLLLLYHPVGILGNDYPGMGTVARLHKSAVHGCMHAAWWYIFVHGNM